MISQDNWHHKNRSWRRFQRERVIMNRVREVLQTGWDARDFDPVTKEVVHLSDYGMNHGHEEWRYESGRYAKKKPYDCGAHHNSNGGHHCWLCHCEDSHKHRNAKLHTAADSDLEDWLNEG